MHISHTSDHYKRIKFSADKHKFLEFSTQSDVLSKFYNARMPTTTDRGPKPESTVLPPTIFHIFHRMFRRYAYKSCVKL